MFSRQGLKSSQKGDDYECFNSMAQEETFENPFHAPFLPHPAFLSYRFSPSSHLTLPSASSRLRVLVPILHSFSLTSPLRLSLLFLSPDFAHPPHPIPTLPQCWLAAKCSRCCCRRHMAENSEKEENQVCSKSAVQVGTSLTISPG